MNKRIHTGLLLLGALGFTTLAGAVDPISERVFVDSFLAVSSSVLTVVGDVLPESSQVGSSYLSGSFDPNLAIDAPANVMITFVHEGAGYLNSLGYFTYTSDGAGIQIVDRQLVFPNASYADSSKGWGGGTLATGDTVTLRDAAGKVRVFGPGERIGFFLVSNGWNKTTKTVFGWDPLAPKLPDVSPALNAGARVMTTIDVLNPEVSTGFADKARHVAMLRVGGIPGFLSAEDFVLVGFEDQRRDGSTDNDFNDLVFLVRSNPIEAIDTSAIPYYATQNPDPDGDGVEGLADYFPEDPERAYIVRSPATGWQTIAFEDRYPNVGDADFNDAVIQMAHEEVLDAQGRLKALSGTYHLFARGATLDHAFGLAVDGLPLTVSGNLELERFAPGDGPSELAAVSPISNQLGNGERGALLRLDDLFPSTRDALSPDSGPYSNTVSPKLDGDAASVRFLVTFEESVSRAAIGTAPFDPYLLVKQGDELWDLHLPGKSGFEGRPSNLPVEAGPDSFVDEAGNPFALLVPATWRFPLERVDIRKAYPTYGAWAASRGKDAKSWYQSPSSTTAQPRVTDVMPETLRTRPWTLTVTR